jgi:hypothetical protein
MPAKTNVNEEQEDLQTAYHLMVDLLVTEERHKDFEDKVKDFMLAGGFCRIDPAVDRKTLVLALRTDQQFSYIHMWKTPNLTNLDLARIMRLSGDDQAYMEIDGLVVDEIQDFVVRVGFNEGSQLLPPEPDGPFMVRAKRRFLSEDLGNYLFHVGMLFPALKNRGIQSFGLYQNATGPLNTVSEFWIANDADPDAEHLIKLAVEELGPDAKLYKDVFKSYLEKPKRDQRETFRSYLPSFVFTTQAIVCEGLREIQGLNARPGTVAV